MESSMHLQRAYERVANFDEIAAATRLRFIDWKIVFRLDGLTTGADVALAFGLNEARTVEIFNRLQEKGLIAENEISLEQYLERAKPPEVPAPLVHATGSPGDPAVRTENSSAASSAVPEAIARRSMPLEHPANGANGKTYPAPAPTNGAISFSIKKRFRLKVVLDFIQGHAGGGTLGQLAVYRTFMLVPSELLRETGLQRLDFNDDSIEIDNPKLRKAIVDAVSKSLRVDLPVGYFLE